MNLEGQVTLVTGGNAGIGRAIALRAGAEGARVVITGRDRTKVASVLAELRAAGADAEFVAADLSDERQAADLVVAVEKRFGGLTVTHWLSRPWLDAVGAWRLFPHLKPS